MNKILNTQFQKIMDESSQGSLEVIISIEKEELNFSEYIKEASEIFARRQTAIVARDLIPPKHNIWAPHSKLNRSIKGNLTRTQLLSAKSIIASYGLEDNPSDAFDMDSSNLFNVFQRQHEVNRAIGKMNDKPVHFNASNSMLLKVSRDRLKSLVENTEGIVNISPNRTIKRPPVYRSNQLPAVVADNKGHAWGIAKTGGIASWGAYNARGQGVRVAVLDTGADPKHPDLQGKIAEFAVFNKRGETIIDDVSQAEDSDTHGTHCAGTIAGGNSSGRFIGMAPDAELLIGMVLKGGSGTDAQILAGLDWAIAKGAHVINMSLGGLQMNPEVFDTYTRSIFTANRRGIPVVVAAGNEGSQTTGAPGNDIFAFTVGATDHNDNVAGFSGGRTQIIYESRYLAKKHLPIAYSKPEVSAPGVDIFSSTPDNGHEAWNGTSMATPHVAGAFAQLLSSHGSLNQLSGMQKVDVLQSLMISTVKDLGEAGQDHRYGFGRIDVLRAIGYAKDGGYW